MADVEWTPGVEDDLLLTVGMPHALMLAEETLIRAKMYAPAPVHDDAALEFRRATPGTKTKLGNIRAVGNPRPSTQELRGSLHVEQDGMGYVVGSDLDYAFYQELGTRKMESAPFLVPALDEAMRRFA
jgi:hypothetical protein